MENFISKVQALAGHILIEPLDETEAIKGNKATFQIAEDVKDAESQRIGTVRSIGGPIVTVYGATITCPPEVKIGSVIIHRQIGYDRFKYKGQYIKLIPFNDVVGIIKE